MAAPEGEQCPRYLPLQDRMCSSKTRITGSRNCVFGEILKMRLAVVCLSLLLGALVRGAQEPTVVVNQGAIVGVKIYPESSRIPIDAYLGIPYAAAPTGRLRFAPPEKHKGWQRTLFAQDFGPPCLQLQPTPPEGAPPPRQFSEDCLYLNIWAPDSEQRFGKLPVVVVLYSDWASSGPLALPGQDLAAEGLLVVSVSYRLNVFGFLCLGALEARGNLGLLDQYFAMLWVRENIERFGGDPEKVTLLGHSAGASSVLYHMVSPRTKALFSRAIMMSGNLGPVWTERDVTRPSRIIASILGCFFDSPKEIVTCLREKPSSEILKAFKTQYQAGNWTDVMVPVVDTFLDETDRFIPVAPMQALSSGNFHQIPILTGLTNLEATDSIEHWQDLARQGYHQLRHYVDYTAIPNVMASHKLSSSPNIKQIREIIKWEYVNRAKEGDSWSLLKQLLLLYSEAQFEAPHEKLLSYLVQTSKPLYVYRYQETGGVDLYGKQLNSTGAAHSSDLPYLFGPTLFQQLTRRRLTQQEERLSKRMRVMWAEFVKFGYPMSPRQYDAWQTYTSRDRHVRGLGGGLEGEGEVAGRAASFWNQLLPHLANLTQDREGRNSINHLPISDGGNDTIRHAMYTLLGLVLALVALLVVCVILLKRTAKERQLGRDFGTF